MIVHLYSLHFRNRCRIHPPIELKEGMVIALETWYGEPGSRDGVRLEDMIVVTKDGCERLCTFPIDCLIDVWNKEYISIR